MSTEWQEININSRVVHHYNLTIFKYITDKLAHKNGKAMVWSLCEKCHTIAIRTHQNRQQERKQYNTFENKKKDEKI